MQRNHRKLSLFGSNAKRWLCTVATPAASTETPTPTRIRSPEKSRGLNKTKGASDLYHKLSAFGIKNGEVFQIMNQWVVNERKTINRSDITGFIDELRKYKQFHKALELLEWMEKRGMHLSYEDHAKRIDLIWKTQGAAAAEKYFSELPKPAKNKFTHGALLNCFCNEKMTEKAMTLFGKMKELNFDLNPFAYNSLITLYNKLGEPEKVPPLVQEMKERNIVPNVFTYNLLMCSYGSLNDVEGAEKFLEEVNKVGRVKPDWTTYTSMASIYVAAGLFDKAESALKEIEKRKMLRDRNTFHFLLTLYGSIGNAEEVNRIWESLKSAFPKTTSISYLTMLQTLKRLDDLDGLKKCFEEWESSCWTSDIRLVNVLLHAYVKHDMIEEAKALLQHAVKKGSKTIFSTYLVFIDFYMKNHHMDFAIKYMKTATPGVKKHELQVYRTKAHMILKYLEEEKDVDVAEELCKFLKQANCLDQDAYGFLLRTYIAAGRTEPQMRQRMKEDGYIAAGRTGLSLRQQMKEDVIEISFETERLLEHVCPE